MSDYIQVLSLALGFSAIAFPTLFFATDRFCKACERRGVNVTICCKAIDGCPVPPAA